MSERVPAIRNRLRFQLRHQIHNPVVPALEGIDRQFTTESMRHPAADHSDG